MQSTGAFTYTRTSNTGSNYRGSDSFVFKAKDGGAFRSDPATVNIYISDDDLTLFEPWGWNSYGLSVTGVPDFFHQPVRNWGLDPGAMAFFPTVVSDGTMFFANYPNTGNPFFFTTCGMTVTCFNPDAATCKDDFTGQATNLAQLHVPSSLGSFFVGEVNGSFQSLASAASCTGLEQLQSGGVDVADVVTFRDAANAERVGFTSTLGSGGGEFFPAFGTIKKSNGMWAVDTQSLVFADTMKARELTSTGTNTLCLTTNSTTDCAGLNELAVLPQSGNLVVTSYFGDSPSDHGGKVAVLDRTGTVLSAYHVNVTDTPCQSATTFTLSPRTVQVDPTSASGDERFIIVFDMNGAVDSQLVQEFSYNSTTRVITPISATFAPDAAALPLTCTGNGANKHVADANYDSDGNLWVNAGNDNGANTLVYLKDPSTQTRRIASDCSYSANGVPRQTGFRCGGDLDLGRTVYGINGSGQPILTYSSPRAMGIDYEGGSMIVTGFNGDLQRILRVSSSPAIFSVSPAKISLDLSNFPTQPNGYTPVVATRSAVDTTRHLLWTPVSSIQTVTQLVGSNPVWPTDYAWTPGDPSSNYLFRSRLDEFDATRIKATNASAPGTISVNSSATISITFSGMSGTPNSYSGLWLYSGPNDTVGQRYTGTSTSTSYSVTVPASAFTTAGTRTWRMFVAEGTSTSGLVVVGRIQVQ